MRITIAAALLAISSTALADTSGYWWTADGHVWRTAAGDCMHTSAWTQATAIPGCDGVPLEKPQAPAPVPALALAPSDSDGDGVSDASDKCPGTPAGVTVDASGCPLDADGDGVADYLDKCPGTPRGALVDGVGCPKKLEKEVSIGLDVTFAFDKADIKGDASQEIRKVSDFMKQYSTVKVTVEGYTDNIGGAEKNKKLSQDRANAVKTELIKDGVDASRLTAVGFGMEHPVADNKTEAGRAQNRRVVAHAQAETEVIEMKK
ncbi:MAG: OmpA family protein [Polyangiales bacterium]